MQMARIFGLALALALTAIPQDLPPGVLLYSQIKRHVAEQLQELQNYTCLETIHRYHGKASRKGEVKSHDSVRLEVLYAGRKDLYSAPGERNFSEENPGAYVTGGLSQNGLFGSYLQNVVVSGAALVTYRGEQDLGGRRSAAYDYRISSFQEPLSIDLGSVGQGNVGLKGTFWADPVSKDVLRLEIQPDDIPPSLPIVSSISVLDYAPVRIGQYDIMIPQSVDSQLELSSGQFERNVLELTHCRAFEAESSISFAQPGRDEPMASTPLLGAGFTNIPSIPPGVHIVLSLSQPVDGRMPVGMPVEARVVVPAPEARDKRSGPRHANGETSLPDGAIVHGRVRSIVRQAGSEDVYLVALEFCDIEVNGARQRFFAELESGDRVTGVEPVITTSSSPLEGPPDLPGVAYFTIRGKDAGLPSGFHTSWKTQPLTNPAN